MRRPLRQQPEFWRKRKTSGYNSPQTHSPKNGKRVPDGAPFLYSIELYCSSPSYRNTKLILLGFRKRCARPIPASSTSLRDASETEGTLPRAKNSPPDCFLNALSSPPPHKSKTGYPEWDNPFLVRRKGLATLWCRRRPAAAEQMSSGHLHFIVRVPSIKIIRTLLLLR